MLYVLFEADESGVRRVSAAGETLRIGLKLLNPSFFNYTEPAPAIAGRLACYRNSAAPASLDAPEGRTLVGSLFAFGLSRAARPVTVTLEDANGEVLRGDTVTAANNRSTVSFDLAGVEPGPCSVKEDYGGGDTVTALHYLHPELRLAGAFGVVDLRIDDAFYGDPPAFEIAFAARAEPLNYYLVTNFNNTEIDRLNVSDTGFAEEGRPEVRFNRVPQSAFTDAQLPAATLASGDARIVLFASQAPVPRRQRARKKIQLSQNGEVLIEHLPQPGPDKADANLIIHVSR
jgi:hypothetical protein